MTNHFPRIRLRNDHAETGGQWLSDSCIPQARKELAEYREEEPRAGWHLEVQGEIGGWKDLTLMAFNEWVDSEPLTP